jgi:hypothetical protein
MEIVAGVLTFVGDIVSAWAMSAWSYYQEKISK